MERVLDVRHLPTSAAGGVAALVLARPSRWVGCGLERERRTALHQPTSFPRTSETLPNKGADAHLSTRGTARVMLERSIGVSTFGDEVGTWRQ